MEDVPVEFLKQLISEFTERYPGYTPDKDESYWYEFIIGELYKAKQELSNLRCSTRV